jgi:hypothetical protein
MVFWESLTPFAGPSATDLHFPDEVVISFPGVASVPGEFTASETQVCPGGTGYVYTVPFVSG